MASMTIRGAMAGVPPAWRRVTSAIVLVPLFVWVTTRAAPWTFQALVVAASLLACANCGGASTHTSSAPADRSTRGSASG